MRKTLQIAKLELSLLFYSPIAWLLMLVLYAQMSYTFIPYLKSIHHAQEVYPFFTFLTAKLFTDPPIGIFSQMLKSLYVYIPLITMGIISRETSSGTIKLLYSSPIKLSQIIFGKFTAMMGYSLVLLGVMGLFVIVGAYSTENFDYQHVIAALLGIFLLLGAYSAIGIFMSSLTTYQVVAAISTFAVFAVLAYVGTFGQSIDFVRDLTSNLSISGRAERMVAGLLNTRDVIYYIVIIGIFLGFTINKLALARTSKTVIYKIGSYVMIIVIGLVVAYLSSRQPMIAYYDATDTKVNTIRKNTQKILEDMGDEPIEVTEYINFLDETYYAAIPSARLSDMARWEPFLRFKSNIKLKWVYYYDSIPSPDFYAVHKGKNLRQIFRDVAKFLEVDTSNFLTPAEVRKQVNLQGEGSRVVMQVKYKGKTTFLRTFADTEFWPSERETAVAFKRLLTNAPKILFATDGYQRGIDKMGDRDYKTLTNLKTYRLSMINQGFDVDSISLENDAIPKDIAALVIADPKVQFSPASMAKVQAYIHAGGNLMIAGEAGKQHVVNPLLDSLGVKMLNGTLVQQSKDFSFGLVAPTLAADFSSLSDEFQNAYQQKIPVSMTGAAALSHDQNGPFTIKSFLMTDAKTSWIKQGAFVLDSAALVFDGKAGDLKGSYPTALGLTRKVNNKEQRIFISGDADFLSNAELGRSNLSNFNFSFANGIFGWFAYGEFPIDTTRPNSRDNRITVSKPELKIIQILYYGVIPGILLLLGTGLLIRRKRK